MSESPMAAESAGSAKPVLEVRRLSKAFPGTLALDRVDLDVRAHEVHALVGENGSGKSTLIKVLAGFHVPDTGTVTIDDAPLKLGDAHASREAGLRFVHQNLALVETLDTVENLALGVGFMSGFAGRIRWTRARQDARERMASLGYSFDVRRPISALAPTERTGVAIARALGDDRQARVLVTDEPTAALARSEVSVLFDAISRLRGRGLAVVYVSHRLDEVCAIADRVTVLRDGQKVGTYDVADVDEDRLFELMIGKEQTRPSGDRRDLHTEVPALEVDGLGGSMAADLAFDVRPGEVLGFAGLAGSGRDEVLSLLFGVAPRNGRVTVDGRLVPPDQPRAAMEAGIALVPADRHLRAAITSLNVRENCMLTDLKRHSNVFGYIVRGAERGEVLRWVERLDIRPPRPDAPFATLSGGNQQKVVLAKWLRTNPRVLLLEEPTQGVDVHAKAVIHSLARDAAWNGCAVLIASSEDNELCETCDRVLVLRDGRIVDELAGRRLTPHEISRVQMGTVDVR